MLGGYRCVSGRPARYRMVMGVRRVGSRAGDREVEWQDQQSGQCCGGTHVLRLRRARAR